MKNCLSGNGKNFYAVFAILAVAALCAGLPGCGGGGGGGSDTTGGGTPGGGSDVAFVSGNVSYPSSGLTKPQVNPDGSVSYKIAVSSSSLSGIPLCPVKIYAIADDGSEVYITTVTANASGEYSITQEQLGQYYDNLILIKAEFTSPISSASISMSQMLNLADPDAVKTGVTVDPVTEAVMQKIIATFAEFGLTLNEDAITALATLINSIASQLQAELAGGLSIEFDESSLAQSYTGTGAALSLVGSGTNIGGLFAGIDLDLLSNPSNTASAAVKKEKLTGFLSMIGFKIANSASDKIYTYIPPAFFKDDTSGTELAISNFTGITDVSADYGSNIYLVQPSLIFVDANSDGEVDATSSFTVYKKCGLYRILMDVPVLSDEFVDSFVAELGTGILVSEVSKTLADNFLWYQNKILIGENGQPVSVNSYPMSEQNGGSAVKPSEIIGQFTANLPSTAFSYANSYCTSDAFLMFIAPDIVNDAIYKGFVANSGFDPDVAIFMSLTTWGGFTNFLKDETLVINNRAPIWESNRDRIQAAIFAGISASSYGSSMKADTEISAATACLFVSLALNRYYLTDKSLGWFKTLSKTIPIYGTITWVEPRYDNYKFLNPTNPETAIQDLFHGLFGTDFAPATFEDAINTTVRGYGDSMDLTTDWFEGKVKDVAWDTNLKVYISHQVAKVNASTGAIEIAGGLTVELYNSDADGATGTFVDQTVTDATEGTFYFDNLAPDQYYTAMIYDTGATEPAEFWFFTDRWGGEMKNEDTDTEVERVKIHFGWVKGDPKAMSSTTTEDRSYKFILTPADGWFSFPWVSMSYGDAIDFSQPGTEEFLFDTDNVFDCKWTPTGASTGTLTAGSGVTISVLNMSTLGISDIYEAKYVGGNSTSFDSIADFTAGSTAASSFNISDTYNDNGDYTPVVYLVESGDSMDINGDGTLETFAWLVQVYGVHDYVLDIEYAILHSSGQVLPPADPFTSIKDYFPLAQDNKWYYMKYSYTSGDLTETNAVIETAGATLTTPDGSAVFPVASYNALISSANMTDNRFYNFNSNNDLILYGYVNTDSTVVVFNTPVVFAQGKTQVGQTSKYTGLGIKQYESPSTTPINTGTANVTITVVGFDNVSTPAMDFDNCLQIYSKIQATVGSTTYTDQSNMYFAMGVGLVKKSTWVSGTQTSESVLVKALLNNGTVVFENTTDPSQTVEYLYAPSYNVSYDTLSTAYSANYLVEVFEAETAIQSITGASSAAASAASLTHFSTSGIFSGTQQLTGTPGVDVTTFTITATSSAGATQSNFTLVTPLMPVVKPLVE
ncbi:MAG: hypothetical protein HZA48_00485 [Planctomycetes bacterium]|nr:hypothetical protein [Planctomycetota bacterium]